MEGKLDWLAEGSINPIPPKYRYWQKHDYEHPGAGTVGRGPAEVAAPVAAPEHKSAA